MSATVSWKCHLQVRLRSLRNYNTYVVSYRRPVVTIQHCKTIKVCKCGRCNYFFEFMNCVYLQITFKFSLTPETQPNIQRGDQTFCTSPALDSPTAIVAVKNSAAASNTESTRTSCHLSSPAITASVKKRRVTSKSPPLITHSSTKNMFCGQISDRSFLFQAREAKTRDFNWLKL